MPQKKNTKPTESELSILQVLWELKQASVRQVNDRLSELLGKEIGYTTTLKLMQIMFEKKLLMRDESARSHIYVAAVEESVVQRKLLHQFVDKAFRGSASQLVMEALGQHRPSDNELAEIKRLIEEMELAKKNKKS